MGDTWLSFQWWNTISNFFFLLNVGLAFYILFKERKQASSLWAWILLLFFLPVIGFLLYLLFGQPHDKSKGKHIGTYSNPDLEKRIADQLVEIDSGSFLELPKKSKKLQELTRMQLKSAAAPLSSNNHFQIYNDGKKKFDALFEDIKNAKNHIHLEYYILKDDTIGNRLKDLLTDKAKEGVKVLFLYDDIGSNALPGGFFDEFSKAGGRAAASLPSRIPWINLRINYRNHRKIAIIDGRIGYTGGFNIGDEYLGGDKKLGYWRDTHVRLEGDAVHTLQHIFLNDWNQATYDHPVQYNEAYFPEIQVQEGAAMQVVISGPDESIEQIKNGFLKLIASAQKSIFIQTPYFIPDQSVLDAIRVAALSGIDVTIVVPNKPDHMLVHAASLSYLEEMVTAGAKVYEYENGFLHAKTLTVDGEALSVGSANLDVRSFSLNYEANLFIYDQKMAEEMNHIITQDVKLSSRVTKELWENRSLFKRGKQRLARMIAPIL